MLICYMANQGTLEVNEMEVGGLFNDRPGWKRPIRRWLGLK